MTESPMTGRLELRWVPVVDERGRTHMEARWAVTDTAPAAPAPTAPAVHAA